MANTSSLSLRDVSKEMLDKLKISTKKGTCSQALIYAGENHPYLVKTIKDQQDEIRRLNDSLRDLLDAEKKIHDAKKDYQSKLNSLRGQG